MNRRTFVRATGFLAVPAVSGLAGCGANDGSGEGDAGSSATATPESTPPTATREPTPTATSTPTSDPTPTPTATPEPTPTSTPTVRPGSLSVADVDDEDVDERRTLLLQVTVENDGDVTRSGVVVGEAEVEDETYTERRQVTVEAGETVEVPVKIVYETAKSIITYTTSASIENDQRGEPDGSLDADPASDVVIADLDETSTDEERTIRLEAVAENLSDEGRTVMLAGEVDISGGDVFRNRRSVTVPGGDRQTETLDVEYESDDAFVSFSYTAWVEEP